MAHPTIVYGNSRVEVSSKIKVGYSHRGERTVNKPLKSLECPGHNKGLWKLKPSKGETRKFKVCHCEKKRLEMLISQISPKAMGCLEAYSGKADSRRLNLENKDEAELKYC